MEESEEEEVPEEHEEAVEDEEEEVPEEHEEAVEVEEEVVEEDEAEEAAGGSSSCGATAGGSASSSMAKLYQRGPSQLPKRSIPLERRPMVRPGGSK